MTYGGMVLARGCHEERCGEGVADFSSCYASRILHETGEGPVVLAVRRIRVVDLLRHERRANRLELTLELTLRNHSWDNVMPESMPAMASQSSARGGRRLFQHASKPGPLQ